MAKKLSLDDLKVQSFVTTLNADEAGQLVGGTRVTTDCVNCDPTAGTYYCGCSNQSNCCETVADCSQMGCPTLFTDTCGCTVGC